MKTLSAFLLFLPVGCHSLRAYGHAYQSPADFTDDEYAIIAERFSIFTVEKRHAMGIYGNASAAKDDPARANSIAATVGTARTIKALNASVKVLMYWNSALNFNYYECESEVEASWLLDPQPSSQTQPVYDYSVAAFRAWWVACAVDAVQGSGGALDGLFLDAVPKVDTLQPIGQDAAQGHWNDMVDALRAALGPSAILVHNGFYLGGSGESGAPEYGGEDAWRHSLGCYVESLETVGTGARLSLDGDVAQLSWIAAAAKKHPAWLLVGHGPEGNGHGPDGFEFGLAKYLLVAASQEDGYFLANSGYNIDQGALTDHWQFDTSPHSVPGAATKNFTLGEPLGDFTQSGWVLRREYSGGYVEVDLEGKKSAIILN